MGVERSCRRGGVVLFGALAVVALTATTGRTEIRSVGVRAGDPIYRELRRLDALGLLEEPLPAIEPLSRREVFRLARSAGRSGDPRARRLLERIAPWERYLDPTGREVFTDPPGVRGAGLAGSDVRLARRAPSELGYGLDRFEGLSPDAELSLAAEDRELSFVAETRLRFDDRDAALRPVVFAAVAESRRLRFVLGREPLTWGPGVHGTLLLSTNARPLDQLRVESRSSLRLPGALARVGAIRFSAFLGRLDDAARAVPDPWLLGHRTTLAPFPWLVVGATRTIMLDGKGNDFDANLDSVWDLLTAGTENDGGAENDTDQKMSVDWGLMLHPLLDRVGWLDGGRFYGEYGGEDALRGVPPSPSASAILLGLELIAGPVLARAEGARNTDDTALWYWHGIYTDGYTYRDRVIGHPMGGDARSLHVDLECEAGRWGLVTVGYERTRHGHDALPGVPPKFVDPPVPSYTEDGFRVTVEAWRGAFPGAVTVETRYRSRSGDREIQDPWERWGLSIGYRAPRW